MLCKLCKTPMQEIVSFWVKKYTCSHCRKYEVIDTGNASTVANVYPYNTIVREEKEIS